MFQVPENCRVTMGAGYYNSTKEDGNNGVFATFFRRPPFKDVGLVMIASDGKGWEHVSVKVETAKRCPNWEEMCFVKSLFWGPEDVVMQLHPAESEYVNNHPNVLHLWRPITGTIPVPDSILVGVKQLKPEDFTPAGAAP